MAATQADEHPSREALQRFTLGLLRANEMDRVEAHLRECGRCARDVPENESDRLVELLRRPATA